MEWNAEIMNEHFDYLAGEASRDVEELEQKARANPLFRRVHDETLARRDVYRYLYGKAFLCSREGLLNELDAMIRSPWEAAPAAFDKDLYLRAWRLEVEEILRQFSSYPE